MVDVIGSSRRVRKQICRRNQIRGVKRERDRAEIATEGGGGKAIGIRGYRD